jgi:hypothetical protein
MRQPIKNKAEAYRNVLQRFSNPQYAAFFDLMENSMLDILVVTHSASEGLKINTLYNNIDRTSFFLKTRVLSDE